MTLPTITTPLAGPDQQPLSCGKPAWLVVLLHEHGRDGDYVLEPAVEWAPTLLKAEFLAPNAPSAADGGRVWFAPGADGRPDPATLDAAASAVLATADAKLAERKLGAERLALVGFGAGAAVVLHAGLMRAAGAEAGSLRPGVGAIVAVAGGLAGEAPVAPAAAGADDLPAILCVRSGEAAPAELRDPPATADALAAAGWPVARQTCDGDWHGLDEDGLAAIAGFLKTALTRPGPDTPADDHDH